MKQTAAMHDIARKTGLSTMTVSRAASNRGCVSQHSRELILAAAKKLGYQRYPLAFDIFELAVVVAGRSFNRKSISHVGVDNFGAAAAITKYLIRLGHRRGERFKLLWRCSPKKTGPPRSSRPMTLWLMGSSAQHGC